MAGGRPWISYARHWVPLALLGAGIGVVAWWLLSPVPAALAIRALFDRDAQKTVAEMEPYVPEGVTARLGEAYGAGPDEEFDVFTPAGISGSLPTIVWIHGGAWISGSKENVDPYARILADRGFTVVTLDYPYGPEHPYPGSVESLASALGFLVDHANEYGIDPDRIVIAGDSAGSNLTSQLALVVTNPDYAALLGITPPLSPEQLHGVVLTCGIYDVSGIPDAPGLGGWGFRIALWAYLGERDWSHTAGGDEMSTIDYVTADFPATWITGGNGDPLTPNQSVPLADRLRGLGVDVTDLFYADDHEPALPHEYQFHLDFDDARAALEQIVSFAERVTG